MNSVEELPTYDLHYFRGNNSYKTAATTYDFPDHTPPPKKDRKWSFGNLFRRRKKNESDSSSEDESSHKKHFLHRKKKGDRRKKTKPIGGAFDHIVTPPGSLNPRQSYSLQNGFGAYRLGKSFDDGAILSDPSGCFGLPMSKPTSIDQSEQLRSNNSAGSVDSLSKKSRRERTKARAIARRDSFNRRSSSDEDDSQRSCSSSKFRSDESLSKRDTPGCRRSRAARTERYIRRLSKDDESILNREAMQRQARENWQIRVRDDYSPTAVSYRSNSRPGMGTPPQYRFSNHNTAHFAYNHPDDAQSQRYSGLFTIPPSHSNIKYRNSNSHHAFDDLNSSRLSMNQQSSTQPSNTNCFNIRSLSCDSNIHKSPSPDEMRSPQRDRYCRNLNLAEQPRIKQPPPPPPRDPRRILQNNNHVDSRPTHLWNSVKGQIGRSQLGRYHRTNSEDVIPTFTERSNHIIRPASVTNEARNKFQGSLSSLVQQDPENFKYMTEKRARSRKPIFIQSTDRINSNNYNSTTPLQQNQKMHNQQRQSPQIFTAQTHVQTKIFLPSTLSDSSKCADSVDSVDGEIRRQNTSQGSPRSLRRESPRILRQGSSSPFKPISPTNLPMDSHHNDDEPSDEIKRKSANLEEALDELEAIYKSLHLGDEDLLERAEQREMSIAAQKLLDSKNETYSGTSRGTLSDSSFSYEPFNALDTNKKKVLKKSRTLDRKNDDMALRKMKDTSRSPTSINNNPVANVSYLLASPVHFDSSPISNDEVDGDINNEDNNEPDITHDDVVYRIVKHANNTLKVADPQPPFGIPIGPVTLASNSDYLHAVPENTFLPYKNNKIPDIVKDDLAYRNLRKDANKEPALKPVSPIDFDNCISKESKKKRAVRSLSANISNIINMEKSGIKKVLRRDTDCENEFKKTKLTDIADAMEIARQILREKENRIQATKRAFLSDSDTKYRRDVTSASSTETITESRLNFLNEMRSLDVDKGLDRQLRSKYSEDDFVHSKPPRGATPDRRFISKEKESTPTPHSPSLSRKDSLNSSFEELLTALAVEARETSDRITNDLNKLDDNLRRKEGTRKHLNEIDAVSEHAKLCEKLLECVVESTELIASTKVESAPEEEVQNIENIIPKSVANVVTTRVDVVEAPSNPVDVEVHSASEQDYDNLISSEVDESTTPSKSPFEEHRAELIASFQELKDSEDEDNQEGEQCAALVEAAANNNNMHVTDLSAHTFVSEINLELETDASPESYVANCDIFIDDYTLDDDEDDDHDSQPSSGFHSNMSDANGDNSYISSVTTVEQIPATLLETLQSPKLVTSAMKIAEAPSSTSRNSNIKLDPNHISKKQEGISGPSFNDNENPSASRDNNLPGNSNRSVACFSKTNNSPTRQNRKTRTWYGDPIVLAFACSYGIACSYQLATLDVVTILGLIFLIISIAAALILE